MHRFALGLLGLVMTMTLAATAGAGGRHDGSFLHQMTPDYVTPHLSWARPLEGGTIRALFITPRRMAGREVVELHQRLDITLDAVTMPGSAAIYRDNIYEAAVTGTSFAEKKAELIEKLQQQWDVIVLGNFSLTALPTQAQYLIVEHTAKGGGLVITYPRPRSLPAELLNNPTADGERITEQIAIAGLPQPLRSAKPGELARTYRFGQGRVVTLKYGPLTGTLYGGLSLTVNEPYTTSWKTHYENNLVLTARAVRWAGGQQPAVRLAGSPLHTQAEIPADTLARDGLGFEVQSEHARQAELELRVRDRWNQVAFQARESVSLTGGQAALTLKPGLLSAGTWYVDWIIHTPGGVADFGYQLLSVTHPAAPLTIDLPNESYEAGERITGQLRSAARWPAGSTLRLQLADLPYGRIWWQQSYPLSETTDSFAMAIDPPTMPTLAGVLRAEVTAGDRVILSEQATLFFPQRELEVFPKIIWNTVPLELPEMFAARVVDQDGWRGGLTHPRGGQIARTAAMHDQWFLPYMTRIGIGADENGVTRLGHWLGMNKDQVQAVLQGDDSFYNPAVQAMWRKHIDLRIEGLLPYGPKIYNLGDENFFNYEAGFAPSDGWAFIQYLQQRYGTIEHLNEQWQSDFADFDSVQRMTPQQLRDAGHFAGWYDHRRFMERQYADTHHFLADYIRSIDPHARVGAEGSVPGDLEYTISQLDFWGPYSDPVMDELLRCIGADKIRSLWWGGYTSRRETFPFEPWRQLLQGVINANSWYSGSVSSEGFMGADLTWADYYAQLRPWLEELDQGLAALLIEQPLQNDGIALLWSHASFSASFMDDRFFSPRDAAQVFLNFSYRHGLNLDMLTTSMVQAGRLDDYRVLILPGASALSAGEVEQIQAFVQRGGVVMADLNPGVLNDYARPLDRSQLADLFGTPELNWQTPLELKPVAIDTTIDQQHIVFSSGPTWQSPAAPVFAWRSVGRGKAILLNVNLGSAQNNAKSLAAFDRWLLDLLGLAKIEPTVQVTGIERDDLLLRLRRQDDCLTVGLLATRRQLGQTVTLTWPRAMHVYQANGRYLGHIQTLEVTLDSPFGVWCAFDQQPKPPRVNLSHQQIKPGQDLDLDLTGLAASGVYRLEIIAPDGQPLRRRTRLILPQQQADRLTIRLAYNDKPGVYRVRLVDVRTGLHGETDAELLKPQL